MAKINLNNFVNVTSIPAGIGALPLNVNNVAIFTTDTPVGSLTNNMGIYRDSASVISDWGSASETVSQANAIFSQSPNILTGAG